MFLQSLVFINEYGRANKLHCVPLLRHTLICIYLHYHRSRKFSFYYMMSNRMSVYNSVSHFPVQFSNNDYLKCTRNSHDTSWTGILDLPFVDHRSVARGHLVTIHHDRNNPIQIMIVWNPHDGKRDEDGTKWKLCTRKREFNQERISTLGLAASDLDSAANPFTSKAFQRALFLAPT